MGKPTYAAQKGPIFVAVPLCNGRDGCKIFRNSASPKASAEQGGPASERVLVPACPDLARRIGTAICRGALSLV